MSDDDDVALPDIRSDEHRRALAARKGNARGPHIADGSDETSMGTGTDPYALATFLADLKSGLAGPPPPPPPPSSKWSPMTILAAVVALITIAGSAATTLTGYIQLGDRLSSFGDRMNANDGRLVILERDFQARGKTRDQEVATLTANNTLQDERLQNITKAIEQERQARMDAEADIRRADADQRAVLNELTKAMSDMRSDLKVLVDRAQRRSGNDPPERDAQAGAAR